MRHGSDRRDPEHSEKGLQVSSFSPSSRELQKMESPEQFMDQ
jgi:hypothetical protein